MIVETKGIVIKENEVGEQDRLVTLLTEKLGVIRAFARGARNIKSKSLSATQLFCYSKMSIFCGKDKYIIREIEPIEVFFGIRQDIEKIALCQYFSQLTMEIAPVEENASEYLRLMLNCLNFAAKGTKPLLQLKAIFEMKSLSFAGYMPNITECSGCGKTESNIMYFNVSSGELTCGDCPHSGEPLDMNILTALRYIIYSDFNRLFSFSLSEGNLKKLAKVSEKFVIAQTQRGYTTLDFYNSLGV